MNTQQLFVLTMLTSQVRSLEFVNVQMEHFGTRDPFFSHRL